MQYISLARSTAVLVLLHHYGISVNFVEVPIFSFNIIYSRFKMMQLSEAGKLLYIILERTCYAFWFIKVI